MKQICAWCRKDIGSTTGSIHPDTEASHGICPSCSDNFKFQLGAPASELIDSVPFPVFLVDSYGVVKEVNRQGLILLCKEKREVVQHLGGNVFECAYARLPEGCGKTVHCSGCAIRRSVNHTFETGAPLFQVPATLKQGDHRVPSPVALEITTVKVGDWVMLRIDRFGASI